MRTSPRHAAGFTLMELLVTVAILSVLLGLLAPSLSGARKSAYRVRAAASLRTLMNAYATHTIDNKDRLLYGYAPSSVNGVPTNVEYNGQRYNGVVTNRYPWRIISRLPNGWKTLYPHLDSTPAPELAANDAERFSIAYRLSVDPAFGINAVYVGGYAGGFYKGFTTTTTNDGQQASHPRTGRHAVFRLSAVRRPSELIAFTEVRRTGPGATGQEGHYWATPPNAAGRMWNANDKGFEVVETDRLLGLPQGRYGSGTLTGFVDTHVKSLSPAELDDMRLWANLATDQAYDVH